MSGEDEGFLKRWSRLKRTGEIVPVPEVEPASMPEVVAEAEIELPPPADTIPLEDIALWLKKRLPDGWREVALRRVWSADIAIRDHIGLADYAWDFTVSGDMPGGVPGWGPLTAADDLAALLSRAIGEVQEAPVPIMAPDTVIADSDSAETIQELAGEPPVHVESACDDSAIADQAMQQTHVISSASAPVTIQERHRRRGGGAMPIFLDDPTT